MTWLHRTRGVRNDPGRSRPPPCRICSMSKPWVEGIGVVISIAALILSWALIIVGTGRTVRYLTLGSRSRFRIISVGALAALVMLLGGWIVYGILLLVRGRSARPTASGSHVRSRHAFISFMLFTGSFQRVDPAPSQPSAHPRSSVRWHRSSPS